MSDKIRQSIPLLGINTATPDSIVVDGALADAMNVRHKNGALQNVCALRVIHPITIDNGYTIVHRMDCLSDNEYIATKAGIVGETDVDVVVIVDEVVTKKATICTLLGTWHSVRYYSLGNVLYVNYVHMSGPFPYKTAYFEQVFIHKNGAFRQVNLSAIDPPVIEKIELEELEFSGAVLRKKVDDTGSEFLYDKKHQEAKNAGFIIGGFFVALAYKMTDGTLIKTSVPMLLSSDVGDTFSRDMRSTEEGLYYYYGTYHMTGIKATIKLPESIAHMDELIKSVTVLTSRVFTVHKINDIAEKYEQAGGSTGGIYENLYPTTLLIDQDAVKLGEPMYELCDVDFRTTREIVIDYDKIKDVVHSPVYTPSFSHHALIGRGKMEYNNRLHIFDTQTRFYDNIYPNYVNMLYPDRLYAADPVYMITASKISGVVEYTIEVDNETLRINRHFTEFVWKKENDPALFLRVSNLVAYPDARATELKLYICDTAGVVRAKTLLLEKVFTQNISYGRLSKLTETEDVLGQNTYIDITSGTVVDKGLPRETGVVFDWQTNRMYVSAMNNPFFVAAQNIYSIGEIGSKIDAINIATEQISETRFGSYPLHIFSDRAIHAMESGTDNVLYASVIGVSNERKRPDTTTVGAANAVMFVGDKGVMALEGRYAVCLSNDINETFVNDQTITFGSYCQNANLLYGSKENELIVYNSLYDYAYIYSLYSKAWTRREWNGTEIGSRQIVTRRGVCSLLDEDTTKPIANMEIKTRPLKLGAMELKRIETVVARINNGRNSNYSITLEGSNDGTTWQQLSKITDQSMIRRTPSSAIYHRLSLVATVVDYFALTHFDVEYYLRFVRRMK